MATISIYAIEEMSEDSTWEEAWAIVEEWDIAYKRRVVSVAVSRKKKVAVDAISNVVKGVFP